MYLKHCVVVSKYSADVSHNNNKVVSLAYDILHTAQMSVSTVQLDYCLYPSN